MRATAAVVAMAWLSACSGAGGADAGAPHSGGVDGGLDAGVDAGAIDGGVDAGAAVVPFTVESYPPGQGKFLRVTVVVDGGAFDVMLDTGSSGLRVISEATLGTPTGESVPVLFGSGLLCGPTESALVQLGAVATPQPIAIQRVVSCDGGAGLEAQLLSLGIHGLLGVSPRADHPQDIYSPLAQLTPELSRGFLVQTGGYASDAGTITLGVTAGELAGYGVLELSPDLRGDGGRPAWDDAPLVCFDVDGTPASPSCSKAYLDTGGNLAIVYDSAHDAGFLPAGSTFEGVASSDAGVAFDLAFTVGAPPATSLDTVRLSPQPYTNLGIGFFFHFDVGYDLANGRLAFRPVGP